MLRRYTRDLCRHCFPNTATTKSYYILAPGAIDSDDAGDVDAYPGAVATNAIAHLHFVLALCLQVQQIFW